MPSLSLKPSGLPVVVDQPDKRHANRTVLCWSGKTDTEHKWYLVSQKIYKFLNACSEILDKSLPICNPQWAIPRRNFVKLNIFL